MTTIQCQKGRKIYQHFPLKDPHKYTQIGIFGTFWQPCTFVEMSDPINAASLPTCKSCYRLKLRLGMENN
jgi:hypothetical protein